MMKKGIKFKKEMEVQKIVVVEMIIMKLKKIKIVILVNLKIYDESKK